VKTLAPVLVLAAPALASATPADGVALLKRVDELGRALAAAAAQEDPAERRTAAAVLVARHFDARTLARRCTKRLRELTDAERDVIGDFLLPRVARELERWLEPDDPARRPRRVVLRREAPVIEGRDAHLIVRLTVDEGAPRRLEVHLRRGRAGWQVWDVRARGVHLSRRYGAHLRQLFARGGAAGLMARIREHLAGAGGGGPVTPR